MSRGPVRAAVRRTLLGVGVVAAVAGCSGTDETSSSVTSAVVSSAVPAGDGDVEALGVEDLGTPVAGQGRIVLGRGLDVDLTITSCVFDDPPAPDPDGVVGPPALLIDAMAEGVDRSNEPVRVTVQRFRADGAAVTITDTVTVTIGPPEEPASAWQAQRFETQGLVTDGRDPDARVPLLQSRAGIVEARGRFAPPGNFLDDGGIVEGAVVLACTT